MENKKAILLLSGGIDSTTLLAKLTKEGYEIVALSFNYGQKHEIELNYAKHNAENYGVKEHHVIELNKMLFNSSALVNNEINISTYEGKKLPNGQVNAYVPFRNLLFLSMALSLAESKGINEVYIAINNDDNNNFWDCKYDFIDQINRIVNLNTLIRVKTPFIHISKSEVIQLSKQLNVDLENTITCYNPNDKVECGHCLSCITKLKALENV